jgi:hypothetical protein
MDARNDFRAWPANSHLSPKLNKQDQFTFRSCAVKQLPARGTAPNHILIHSSDRIYYNQKIDTPIFEGDCEGMAFAKMTILRDQIVQLSIQWYRGVKTFISSALSHVAVRTYHNE